MIYELHADFLRGLESFLLVNDNLCEKLVSLFVLQIKFDDWLKITSVEFSVAFFAEYLAVFFAQVFCCRV